MVVADFSGVVVMPVSEAEEDLDWALGKQAAEPEGHKKMLAGEKIGERSGATAKVLAKIGG